MFLMSPFLFVVIKILSAIPNNWIRSTMIFFRFKNPGEGLNFELAETSVDKSTQFQNEGEERAPIPGTDGGRASLDKLNVVKIAEDPDEPLVRNHFGDNSPAFDVLSSWESVGSDVTGNPLGRNSPC